MGSTSSSSLVRLVKSVITKRSKQTIIGESLKELL